MNKFEIDNKFGELNEMKSEKYIQEYYKQTTLTKLSKYHQFDYEGNDSYFEIKSRRNLYKKYPTTMIGYNKLELAMKTNDKNVYFIFEFIDGSYYYKFNRDDEHIIKKGGRSDRGRFEYKLYCYIPIEKLIKIEL
jgi:hypothetical protein